MLVVGSYVLLNNGLNMDLAPLEHREDKTTRNALANIEIEASTFNGCIEIQRTV